MLGLSVVPVALRAFAVEEHRIVFIVEDVSGGSVRGAETPTPTHESAGVD
ncbi:MULTISPECIES: hypothetical protein [unclassified Hyphomicrobium]|nr:MULTISPECIES: hypothetical protein [unclassified Hyphomicrobium]